MDVGRVARVRLVLESIPLRSGRVGEATMPIAQRAFKVVAKEHTYRHKKQFW